MRLEEIINRYEHLWMPCNFVHLFKSMKEFEDWASMGTAEDVLATLKLFEKDELYEHCQVLLKIYNEKKSEQLHKRD